MNLKTALNELFEKKGSAYYGAEPINQLQHALQSACLAEREGAGRPLIVAALLHDVGHLLGRGDEGLAEAGTDARHEVSGARYLSRWFGPAVSEPVRLHVEAKSYLCAVDREYYANLTRASQDSLAVQGGVFDEEQAAAFARETFFEEAVRLRRWDDRAKDPAAETPDLQYYLAIAEEVAAAALPAR